MARFTGDAPVRGVLLGAAIVGLLTVVLLPLRGDVDSAPPALGYVLAVAATTVVGGPRPAALVIVLSGVALDLVFVPPYSSLDVTHTDDLATLAAFVLVTSLATAVLEQQARRRREAEAREREVKELGARLRELDAERIRLNREAERAETLARIDDERSALLRSVSHDLRTPLSAILAIVSDLRDSPPYDEAVRSDLLTVVSDEVERLDRLVANLLRLSRIEAGASLPERQAIDLHDLVDDRLRRLAPLFRHVRVRTDLAEDLPLVDGDYAQLEQVLTNLFDNLARHAPSGTDVWVLAREKDGSVLVEVSDRGDGVPEEQWDQIFEPFQRGERGGSSGIGLAICKAVVEAHGGTIRVEHTFGGGATFAFTLPIHRGEVVA